jgi:hypothetical protein
MAARQGSPFAGQVDKPGVMQLPTNLQAFSQVRSGMGTIAGFTVDESQGTERSRQERQLSDRSKTAYGILQPWHRPLRLFL